jgi:plastocyanin
VTRREFLVTGATALAGIIGPPASRAVGVVEIRAQGDALGSDVWFDPVGVLIEPGQTVRWIVVENIHTTTAYHPRNEGHCLRIPEGAEPWNSGYLVGKGSRFEVALTAEGVYDYFCQPHEAAGMVGRIIVGRPGGPGALPFDYYAGRAGTEQWKPVPEAARAAFPSIDAIMRHGRVRRA